MPPACVGREALQKPLDTILEEHGREIMTGLYLHPLIISQQNDVTQEAVAVASI
jgi:hypothetical protein